MSSATPSGTCCSPNPADGGTEPLLQSVTYSGGRAKGQRNRCCTTSIRNAFASPSYSVPAKAVTLGLPGVAALSVAA